MLYRNTACDDAVPQYTNTGRILYRSTQTDPPVYRRAYEVFTLLLRVEEHPELREGGKVIWRLQYLSGGRGSADDTTGEQRRHQRRKIVTQLNLQKDDTQMVLPMAKVGDGSPPTDHPLFALILRPFRGHAKSFIAFDDVISCFRVLVLPWVI